MRPARFTVTVAAHALWVFACVLSGFGLAASRADGLLLLLPVGACLAWFTLWKRSAAAPDVVLTCLTVVNAVALSHGAAAAVPILGEVVALAAWDLARFDRVLSSARRIDRRPETVRRHVRLLVVVLGVGAAMSTVVLLVKVELPFAAVLGLAAAAVAGLVFAVRSWRSDPIAL